MRSHPLTSKPAFVAASVNKSFCSAVSLIRTDSSFRSSVAFRLFIGGVT